MYRSTFPTSPHIENYLRAGRMISDHETAQDMATRIVAALETADATFDPAAAPFGERLGWALDTERVVFSTPIMTRVNPQLAHRRDSRGPVMGFREWIKWEVLLWRALRHGRRTARRARARRGRHPA